MLSQSKQIDSLGNQISELRALLNALGSCQIPWLHRLLHNAQVRGEGPAEIMRKVEQAIAGQYEAKSFTVSTNIAKKQQWLNNSSIKQREYDLSALTLHLGGPQLLHSLSTGLGLPGLTTTYRNSNLPQLLPSVQFPTHSEVLQNIEASFHLFSPSQLGDNQACNPPLPVKRGFSLLIDEIALEERPQYSSTQDALIGFCREHSGLLSKSERH